MKKSSGYKSKAFVYYKPYDVKLEEVDIKCDSTDIIIKVLASARCGTDKTIFYKGHPKVDRNAPIILGHELVGEIVEVGKKVKELRKGIGYKEKEKLTKNYLNFKIGEKVTVQSRIARYRNKLMLLSEPITILSFYINGAYSQYMKIPKELIQSGSVLRIPKNITHEEGSLIEPTACALESIFATSHPIGINKEGRHIFSSGIKKGGISCVIGSGTVSMIYAMLCKVEGAKEIYMIVRSSEKEKLIRKVLGDYIKVIINKSYRDKQLDEKEKIEDKLVEEIKEKTKGRLFDDCISACADSDAQRLMLKLLNPEGYGVAACFGGTHDKVDRANLDILHYRSGKCIGTSGTSTRTMETVISWLKEGKISLKGFTSNRKYTLDADPKEFFTTEIDGLKPVLYPWLEEAS